MEIIPWILAAALAGLAAYLGLRKPENPYPEALGRLLREAREADEIRGAGSGGDPPEVRDLREALADRWSPVGGEEEAEDPEARALRGLSRYLRHAVYEPLQGVLRAGDPPGGLKDAVAALEDLAYYSGGADRRPAPRVQNVSSLVQAVTREYTVESGVSVKFVGPDKPVSVTVDPERFKDAVFLLLSNAGRFGEGRTVEVAAEEDGSGVRLFVRDRGPGFTPEALERAFEPFWSTDPDALGLGLTHARRVLEGEGGVLRIRNREDGGAEVVISLSRNS